MLFSIDVGAWVQFGVKIVRRWLYIFAFGFWLVVVLLPVSFVSYWVFYKSLITSEMVRIPLTFEPVSALDGFALRTQQAAAIDGAHMISRLQEDLDIEYLINLNIEVLCNRNRIDDVYPIHNDFEITNTNVRKAVQFILNCDARCIYHGNNRVIPYNLRFWTPPLLTNINKNVNIDSAVLTVSSRELKSLLYDPGTKSFNKLKIALDRDIIINHQNTYLEFIIQWKGIRFYMTYYYKWSMFIGISIFWSNAMFFSMVTGMTYFTVIKNEETNKKRGTYVSNSDNDSDQSKGDDWFPHDDDENRTLEPEIKVEPGLSEF